MAVPQKLLQQLLALDESARLEIGHALLDSVEAEDEMRPAERAKLDAAIGVSIEELDAGKGVPIEQAIAEIRAKRGALAPATR